MLQVLLARHPSERPPIIRAWWPERLRPPQLEIDAARACRRDHDDPPVARRPAHRAVAGGGRHLLLARRRVLMAWIEISTPLRDGVVLQADRHETPGNEARPVLLIRTPYGRQQYREDSMVAKAVARGYRVVVQDVRGRYGSGGEFDPYKNEGADGFDTIEWIASQPWSNGRVATAGLSYPGAAQWLAAVEAPPHLVCAFPAMCFSSARQFFYFGGAFDLSWLPWTANNIAPDDRRRKGVSGPATGRDARAWWREHGRNALRRVPLRSHPLLEGVTPFYDEWLDHPDDGPYWDFAEI